MCLSKMRSVLLSHFSRTFRHLFGRFPLCLTVHDIPLILGGTSIILSVLSGKDLSRTLLVVGAVTYGLRRITALIFPKLCVRPLSQGFGATHTVGVRWVRSDSLTIPHFVTLYPIISTRALKAMNSVPWLPFGNLRYASEFAQSLHLPQFLTNHLSECRIEATLDAPSLYDQQNMRGKAKYVVFSHGLYGHMNMYSTLAQEWAARGYVVLCPEHRDGSAVFTTCVDKEPIPFRRPSLPHNDPGVRQLRYDQVQHRTEELLALIRDNVPSTAQEVILAGHSFGATTALNTAIELRLRHCTDGQVESFPVISRVVTFDLWTYPLEHIAFRQKLSRLCSKLEKIHELVPIRLQLFDSEEWYKCEERNSILSKLFLPDLRKIFTLSRSWRAGTDHHSASDMGLLNPYIRRKRAWRQHCSDSYHIQAWALRGIRE